MLDKNTADAFVQAMCGGCHMVVLAQPRDQSEGDVTLEDGDVTEDYLEKPYGELRGGTADDSALLRSLSARVRRRERVGGVRMVQLSNTDTDLC